MNSVISYQRFLRKLVKYQIVHTKFYGYSYNQQHESIQLTVYNYKAIHQLLEWAVIDYVQSILHFPNPLKIY